MVHKSLTELGSCCLAAPQVKPKKEVDVSVRHTELMDDDWVVTDKFLCGSQLFKKKLCMT